MHQPCLYIYPLCLGFSSHLEHHRALSRILCAVYNRPSLAIYFIHSISSVYMSILISQFIPPPSSWYSNICSLYLRLYFCFIDKIVYTNFFFRFHIYVLIYGICFSLWLSSLCITILDPFRSLQMTQFHFFLWLSNIPLYVYAPHLTHPFFYWWPFRLFPCPGYWK